VLKKFDILRYLRRFFALVLAVTMAGTVVVYWYCKNNQTYTASVNIKYLHDGIKDGFAPDGTAMNVDEIYSSKVISQAMESLGLQSGINLVRSHCTVEELIPDDQKALQEALIDKGEESTYFPDEYAGGGRQPGCELRPPGAGCHRQQLFHHLHGGICGAASDHEPLQRPAEQRLRLLRVRGRAVGRHHRSAELSGG